MLPPQKFNLALVHFLELGGVHLKHVLLQNLHLVVVPWAYDDALECCAVVLGQRRLPFVKPGDEAGVLAGCAELVVEGFAIFPGVVAVGSSDDISLLSRFVAVGDQHF